MFNPSSYTAYDTHRSALESRALAQRQQQRRQAEEVALYREYQRQEALAAQRQAEEARYRRSIALENARRQELEREAEIEAAREWFAAQQGAASFGRRHFLADDQEHHTTHSIPRPSLFSSPTPRARPGCNHGCRCASPASPIDDEPQPRPQRPRPEETIHITIVTPPPAPVQTEAEIEAAATLQRHFRTHLLRRQKLSTLNSLATALTEQKTAFVPPTTLVFQSPSTSSLDPLLADNHKLAFSKVNGPFLAFEDFLVGLLSKADAVESEGDAKVKEARKALVHRVEEELKELDAMKETSWTAQNIVDPVDDSSPLVADPEPTPTPSESTTAAEPVPSPTSLLDAAAAIPSDVPSDSAATTAEAQESIIPLLPIIEPPSEKAAIAAGEVVDGTRQRAEEEFIIVSE